MFIRICPYPKRSIPIYLYACMYVIMQYDRTIRNSLGEIVQFLYGEDGMAGEFIEDLPMTLMTKNPRDFDRTYKHDYTSLNYGRMGFDTHRRRDTYHRFNYTPLGIFCYESCR